LLCALLFFLSFYAKSQTIQDVIAIRANARIEFRGTNPPGQSEVNALKLLLDAQNATNGSWTDVVYSDTDDGTDEDNDEIDWDPIQHLTQLTALSEAYAWGIDITTMDGPQTITHYTNAQLGDRIILGLQYWYWYGLPANGCNPNTACSGIDNCASTCPCAQDWWWNTIGKLRELQKIAILVYDRLTATTPPVVPTTTTTLLNAIIANFPVNTLDCNDTDAYTGANLTEVAINLIVKGMLSENIATTTTGVTALKSAVVIASEGLQVDDAFHQHGPLLYTGGYGHEFLEAQSVWANILLGDIINNYNFYEYTPDQRLALYRYVFNGYRWMLVGNTTDYSTGGRYIARKHPNSNGAVSSRYLNRLRNVIQEKGDQAALQGVDNLVTAMNEMTANDDNFSERQNIVGDKYFWRSDYVVHHEDAYVSSIKMCSDRTIGTESVNHENKLGFWLPYGCTLIYHQGNEYTNIFPMWDWRKIPGVTSADFDEPFDDPDGSTMESTQNEAFVGSAGNNDYSTTTMVLNKPYSNGTVQAKKAWFNFGDEIIALGAGISGGSNATVTTINQTHLVGNISHANAPTGTVQTISAGVADPTTPTVTNWIEHNGTAYIFPNNEDVYVSTESKTEPWTRIGTKSGSESGNIFKAWINHTASSSSSYYYIIAPGQGAASYAGSNPVTLLKNTSEVQAVKKDRTSGDLAGIVFYPGTTPAPVNIGDANNPLWLSTDHPCALLYDGSTNEVCISSPDREHSSITLIFSSTTDGVNFTTVAEKKFILPSGEEEGTSICKNINELAGYVSNSCFPEEGVDEGVVAVEIQPLNSFTDSQGEYRKTNPISGGNYVLDPKKDINYSEFVDVKDAAEIYNHYTGGSQITDTYELIAADVNKSSNVDGDDYRVVRDLILGNITNFANVDSWEFAVDGPNTFTDINNPFAGSTQNNPWPFLQTISIPALPLISPDYNFIGIKMGDVFCNRYLRDNPIEPDTCEPEILILVEDRPLVTNEIFTITLHVENFTNIQTYQFGMIFKSDKIQYQGLQSGDLNNGAKVENFGLSSVNNGRLRTLWMHNEGATPPYTIGGTTLSAGASLFKLQFKALENTSSITNLLKLNDEDFRPVAHSDVDTCEHTFRLQFMPVGWSGGRDDGQIDDKGLSNKIRVHPNPTTGALSFEISTDIAAENTIQIYSTTGQQVLRQSVYLEKGNNTVPMEDISNWQDGLYFYTITDSSGLLRSGKFVKN
jgi:chondroitin AC lyase